MAVAVKNPRAVLMLYLERRKALAEKIAELEDALPVVAEVGALSKQKKASQKEVEQLKKQLEQLEAEREKLHQQSDELQRKRELIEKALTDLEKLADTGAATGEGTAAPSNASAVGGEGAKGRFSATPI